jgi:vacuolar-type H+-ATPase subunit I/STV1
VSLSALDPWQFYRPQIRAWGKESSLDISDVRSRMHVEASQRRKRPAPEWALNDRKLQQVLCVFFERRAGLRKVESALSYRERLDRAQQKLLKEHAPKLERSLKRLCKRYVKGKRPRRIEQEIENLDTQLSLLREAPAKVVAVIVYSYRLNLLSPEIGQLLGLKPPQIRVNLHRLNKLARRMAHHGEARALAQR